MIAFYMDLALSGDHAELLIRVNKNCLRETLTHVLNVFHLISALVARMYSRLEKIDPHPLVHGGKGGGQRKCVFLRN